MKSALSAFSALVILLGLALVQQATALDLQLTAETS
jgi:hypothetical protein